MSRKSDAFWAFLAGAAVGASVGILFAPEKGEVTRQKLALKLEKYKEKLSELISKYTKEQSELVADNVVTAAKTEGMKVVKDAKAQAEALLGDVEELIGQIKGRKA
jgi:gas vesicle protein